MKKKASYKLGMMTPTTSVYYDDTITTGAASKHQGPVLSGVYIPGTRYAGCLFGLRQPVLLSLKKMCTLAGNPKHCAIYLGREISLFVGSDM